MTSFYRVIVYTPDLVRDERINVGVIAFDHTRVLVRLLKPEAWPRVEAFGGNLTRRTLEDWAAPMRDWTPEQAREHRNHYLSSLWLREPLASITTVYALLDRIGDRMLVEFSETPVAVEVRRAGGIPLPGMDEVTA